jgi:tight adherence protein B
MRCKRALNAVMAVVLAFGLALSMMPSAAGAADEASSLTLYGVDTEAFPTVITKVGLPADLVDASGAAPKFTVTENGSACEVLSAVPQATSRKVQVALLIDTSGSMKGQPIAYAKDAAKRFVAEMSGKAEVAIVTFSSSAQVVSGYSADTAALTAAIDSLGASGETAVYDAISEATKIAGDPEALRAFVLVSDGGDTTSVSTLDQAVKTVQASGIPVLAIALESPEFNQEALRLVAEQSGGRLLSVADVEQLPAYFTQLAKEISSVYEVTYTSVQPRTKGIDIDVNAETSQGTGVLQTTVNNPMYFEPVTVGDSMYEAPKASPWVLGLSVVLAFASVGLLATAVMSGWASRKVKALGQMRYYDQLKGDYSKAADPEGSSGVRAKMVDAVDAVAGRGGFTNVIGQKLERAGMPLRPAEWIAGHIILVVVAGFLTQLLTGRLWVSVLVVIVAAAVPILLLDNKGTKRVRDFETQLPDVLALVASGLRTGWGLQQAIGLVVSEGAPPATEEFRRVQIETRLGVPVEQALESMAKRLGSEMFEWVVSAIAIQREVGGNLAQVLDNVAASVRERDALHRQVAALTAEGRLSAVILTLLPFVIVGAILVVSPDYLIGAISTPLGVPLVIAGVLLLCVGILWLRSVSRIDY